MKFIKGKWYRVDSVIDLFIKYDRVEWTYSTQIHYSESISQGEYSNIPSYLSSNLTSISQILKPQIIKIDTLIEYLPSDHPIRVQWIRDQKLNNLLNSSK